MNTFDMIVYAVRRKFLNGEVDYWDFCADCWVTPEKVDLDCITSKFAAEAFARDNGGEVVKIKANLAECGYYDEKENFEDELTLLQEEEHKIEDWLKENGYTDGCLGARFEPSPINDNQGRAIDFEYNGNIEDLDVEELADAIDENVLDDRFSVRVFVYDEEDGEAYKNLFCVEIWLNE